MFSWFPPKSQRQCLVGAGSCTCLLETEGQYCMWSSWQSSGDAGGWKRPCDRLALLLFCQASDWSVSLIRPEKKNLPKSSDKLLVLPYRSCPNWGSLDLCLLSWYKQKYPALDDKWHGHPPFSSVLSHCTVNLPLDMGSWTQSSLMRGISLMLCPKRSSPLGSHVERGCLKSEPCFGELSLQKAQRQLSCGWQETELFSCLWMLER